MLSVWTSLEICCLVKSYALLNYKVLEKIGIFGKELTLYHRIPTFADPEKNDPFENIVGIGENAGNQHFLLFPQCFLPIPKRISVFKLHLFCRLQLLSIWTGLKISRLVKG